MNHLVEQLLSLKMPSEKCCKNSICISCAEKSLKSIGLYSKENLNNIVGKSDKEASSVIQQLAFKKYST